MNGSPWLLFRAGRAFVALAGLLLSLAALPAFADPPESAMRLSHMSGNVSFAPAGSDQWVQARINRPLWIGDRLWSAEGRAELQLGGASLRLAPRTALTVLNFDDRLVQFEVTEGSVALHVRVMDRDDVIEIDTPTFAFVTQQAGDYRIDVESDRTAVAVRRGFCDVYGTDVAYRIDRREQYVFYGTDLRDYDVVQAFAGDPFDRWVNERVVREERSVSARYVAPELVGYADLDQYGDWRTDANYGAVWIPRVRTEWAPYRYGHWSWIDPWGWTWVDDAPWGFAPFHYGRWAIVGTTWAWVPGPRTVRPVYSPALVAWVGGPGFSLSIGSGARGVAWFPLAPGEVWAPSYDTSRDYFTRVNVSNTVVNQTTVVNVYTAVQNNAPIQNVQYRHRTAPRAVTAVATDTLVTSRPVNANLVQVQTNVIAQAPVAAAPAAQPTVQSYVGAAAAAQARPPAAAQRPVVARTAPAAALPTLEDKANLMKQRGNKPIDKQELERVAQAAPAKPAPQAPAAAPGAQPSAAAPAAAPNQLRSNVRVVEAQKVQPKPAPPAPPETAERAERRKADQARGRQPAEGTPPSAAAPGAPKPPATAESEAAKPPATAQPGAPKPPTTAQPSAPKPPASAEPRPAAPPATATGPADQRGRAPAAPPGQAAAPARPEAGASTKPPTESTERADERRGREAAASRAAESPPRAPEAAVSGKPTPGEPPRTADERRGREAAPPRAADTQPRGPEAAGRPAPAESPRAADERGGREPTAPRTAAAPPPPGSPAPAPNADRPGDPRGRAPAPRPEAAAPGPTAQSPRGPAADGSPRGEPSARGAAPPSAAPAPPPQAAAPAERDARSAPPARPGGEDVRRAAPAAPAGGPTAAPKATPPPPLPPSKGEERPAPRDERGKGREDPDEDKEKEKGARGGPKG